MAVELTFWQRLKGRLKCCPPYWNHCMHFKTVKVYTRGCKRDGWEWDGYDECCRCGEKDWGGA